MWLTIFLALCIITATYCLRKEYNAMFFKKKKGQKSPKNVDEYSRLMGLYREELQDHDISVQSFAMLAKHDGLINLIKEYVLTETGIGDGVLMCGFSFPNIFQPWEKETEKTILNPEFFLTLHMTAGQK